MAGIIITNGKEIEVPTLPLTVEQFLISQGLLPRSVVVEYNGNATAPSEFGQISLHDGDRIEIVRIVAGG